MNGEYPIAVSTKYVANDSGCFSCTSSTSMPPKRVAMIDRLLRRAIDGDRGVRLEGDVERLFDEHRMNRFAVRILAIRRHRRRHDLLRDLAAFFRRASRI